MRALLCTTRRALLFVLMAKMRFGSQGISSGAVVRRKMEKSSVIFQKGQMKEGSFAKEQKESA